MVCIVVVTRVALLIARRASPSTWTVDEHLGGRSPKCVAADLRDPAQVYCGTRWCRSLPKPRRRLELGTSRIGH